MDYRVRRALGRPQDRGELRRPARQDHPHHAEAGRHPAGTEPGVDATYAIPAGNLFPVGTAKTRPEIYAMGFRQPFTVHTDPANPGIIGMGEYCHDNSANGANRSPAGICEWNLINKAGNFGWPFCIGNNSTANTNFRWNYATATRPAAVRLLAGHDAVRHPLRAGRPDPGRADLRRSGHAPQARIPATIWKKYAGRRRRPERGRLRRPRRRRHAADHRPDLPLRRGHAAARARSRATTTARG